MSRVKCTAKSLLCYKFMQNIGGSPLCFNSFMPSTVVNSMKYIWDIKVIFGTFCYHAFYLCLGISQICQMLDFYLCLGILQICKVLYLYLCLDILQTCKMLDFYLCLGILQINVCKMLDFYLCLDIYKYIRCLLLTYAWVFYKYVRSF